MGSAPSGPGMARGLTSGTGTTLGSGSFAHLGDAVFEEARSRRLKESARLARRARRARAARVGVYKGRLAAYCICARIPTARLLGVLSARWPSDLAVCPAETEDGRPLLWTHTMYTEVVHSYTEGPSRPRPRMPLPPEHPLSPFASAMDPGGGKTDDEEQHGVATGGATGQPPPLSLGGSAGTPSALAGLGAQQQQ